MLNDAGIHLSDIGADTVLVGEMNKKQLYICAHFKELKISDELHNKQEVFPLHTLLTSSLFQTSMKKQDMKFINQMVALNTLVLHFYNLGWECYILCDANTQVCNHIDYNQGRNDSLTFYEKEQKNGEYRSVCFQFDFPIVTPFHTEKDMLRNWTTNKMRGFHTAQLNKSLVPAASNIDYALFVPRKIDTDKYLEMELSSYKLTDTGKLVLKQRYDLTTSPISISDHAPVVISIPITSTSCTTNDCLGTFNIMGGNEDDNSWAEFIPEEYKEFFLSKQVQDKIDMLLLNTFDKYCAKDDDNDKLTVIKRKNFVSEHRFKICEEHIHPDYVPFIKMNIDDKSIVCSVYIVEQCVFEAKLLYSDFTENVKERYRLDNLHFTSNMVPVEELTKWVNVLLEDLNQYNKKMTQLENMENQMARIVFFQDKVIPLLNFYATIQTNTEVLYDNKSLYNVYKEWYLKKSKKVSIANILKKLKRQNRGLNVVALQEFPTEPLLVEKLMRELEEIAGGKLFINQDVFVIDNKISATRGAIFVFNNDYTITDEDEMDVDVDVDVDVYDPNMFNNKDALFITIKKMPVCCLYCIYGVGLFSIMCILPCIWLCGSQTTTLNERCIYITLGKQLKGVKTTETNKKKTTFI